MKDGLKLIPLRERNDLAEAAAKWFHSKWGVSEDEYTRSMAECAAGRGAVPQWYIVRDGGKTVAGLGVIENDFHPRRDLAPNVCAVYVEKEYRNTGIAGEMLAFACDDMAALGERTLYLITSHIGFYERYGWQYHTSIVCDGETKPSRVYVHRTQDLLQ